MPVPPDQSGLRDLIRLDAAVHFATCAMIRDKQARMVLGPKPNVLQKRGYDHYRACQVAGKPCKIVILKPRQTGASTFAQHLMYFHAQKYPGTNACVMGDIAGTSDKVFDVYRRFAQHDPFEWGGAGVPNLDAKDNLADDIRLWNGSAYAKTTAGSKNAGRSGTIQAGNLTEPAFYRTDGGSDPTLAFLNSAYDGGPECLYVADSTPNGPQGWFYRTCMAALEGRTEWKLVFAAWFEFDEHAARFDTPAMRAEFLESLDEDERVEMERYGCTAEKMLWRRRTIADKCGGEVAKFRQEYPSDVHECFLLSSRPRFHQGKVQLMAKDAEAAALRARRVDITAQENGAAAFTADKAGQWLMHEEPREGCHYLVSVDVCTGEDQQLEQGLAPDPDWHSAQVWRGGYYDPHGAWHRPRLVCEHHSRLEVAYLAAEVAAAARLYGGCLIVPEVNGPGLALVKFLRDIHRCRVYQRRKVNDSTGLVEKAYGWHTDALTRKTIIDSMARMIVEDEFECPSELLARECRTFIVNRSGKPEAAPQMHDDCVLAAAIGLFNLRAATELQPPRRSDLPAMLRRNPTFACPDGFMRVTLGDAARRNGSPKRAYSRG